MRPKHRNRRLATVAVSAVTLAAGVALMGFALSANRQYFHKPSEVVSEGFVPQSDSIRVGGLVVPGSVEKGEALHSSFGIVDFDSTNAPQLSVTYVGILPDLFKESSGVVVTGVFADGVLLASEVLAKHDENYRPKLD